MFPMFFLPPEVVVLSPEHPRLPLWLTLSVAGAATLLTALAYTLS